MSNTVEDARAARSTAATVKLLPLDRERLAAIAQAKQRSTHHLMREAIHQYIEREEASARFVAAAEESFEHYKATGLHVTLDEFNAWAEAVQQNPAAQLPACHS